jgi:hypothetical protein
MFINGELTDLKRTVTKSPTKRLKGLDNLQPAVFESQCRNEYYLFALPIFKNKPRYLLLNNIIVEYPNEVPSFRASYRAPGLEGRRT